MPTFHHGGLHPPTSMGYCPPELVGISPQAVGPAPTLVALTLSHVLLHTTKVSNIIQVCTLKTLPYASGIRLLYVYMHAWITICNWTLNDVLQSVHCTSIDSNHSMPIITTILFSCICVALVFTGYGFQFPHNSGSSTASSNGSFHNSSYSGGCIGYGLVKRSDVVNLRFVF